jgi:hypothetical protein
MEKQRLPRALDLKKQVDQGETLSSFDLAFLDEVFSDVQQLQSLLDRHPEWQPLVARLIHLYKEITERALANEQAPGS